MKVTRLGAGEYTVSYHGHSFWVVRRNVFNPHYADTSWYAYEHTGKGMNTIAERLPRLRDAKAAIKEVVDEQEALTLLGEPTPVVIGYPTGHTHEDKKWAGIGQ